jgi:predicted metal-dependent TIM-barrel fold hydrolase
VGPILEAFGTDRILYASSGSVNPGDWYELAREVVAELGVEQEAVDAVFCGNASGLFGPSA